ncbi:MAG: hypothetical protein ACLSHC_05465 [Bilophila wadsworthia]
MKLDAEDGEMYELRVFQTGNGKIGLRVQYEKNHIINGARTVRASFDTAGSPGACGGVQAATAPQAKPPLRRLTLRRRTWLCDFKSAPEMNGASHFTL